MDLTSKTPSPELEDGNVEGTAAQVVYGDGLLLLLVLVEAEGEGGRSRLVDDALDLEAGDLARVLGGLALRVVEIGGHRDDRLADRLAEIVLGGLLHLLEDEGGDFLGAVALAGDIDADVGAVVDDVVGHELGLVAHLLISAPHETLDRVDRVLGVGDHLVLGRLADHALALGRKADDGGSRALALGVGDDDGLPALHDRHAGIGGAEIDSDYPSHILRSFLIRVFIGARRAAAWRRRRDRGARACAPDLGGPEYPIMKSVAGEEFLRDDGFFAVLRAALDHGDGLVMIRIEGLAQGLEAGEAVFGLEIEPSCRFIRRTPSWRTPIVLLDLGAGDSAVEIVQNRDQVAEEGWKRRNADRLLSPGPSACGN